jgi:RNA polymerase sigma factor (sigma-70 family)
MWPTRVGSGERGLRGRLCHRVAEQAWCRYRGRPETCTYCRPRRGPARRRVTLRARYRGRMVRLSQGSDAGGSDGCRTGLNPRSFAAFYERQMPGVLDWMRRRTHNDHLAVELTARTFLKAFEQRDQHRGSTEVEAVGWVRSIARRELLQFLRHGKVERAANDQLGRDLPPLTDDEAHRIDEVLDATAARTPLGEALDRLSSQQREAFERRFGGEETDAEIAAKMRISEIAVRQAVFRARKRLAHDPRLRRIVLGDD